MSVKDFENEISAFLNYITYVERTIINIQNSLCVKGLLSPKMQTLSPIRNLN